MDRQQDVIRRITAHVTAYRFWRHNQTIDERRELRAMAIEIKGLRSDALLARANIDRVRAAYARFNQAAPAHADDVDKLASDITGMQSDLEFAATVMGNSSGESAERLSDGQKPPVVPPNIMAGVGDLNQPKAAPESIVAQQTAFAPLSQYDRVALGPHPDQPAASPGAIAEVGQVTGQTFSAQASASADPQPNGANVLVRAAE